MHSVEMKLVYGEQGLFKLMLLSEKPLLVYPSYPI